MLETIWNSILPNILEIIFTIISLVVAYYVVPYIKNDLIPWLKEQRLYNMVKNFVQAAEKMAESGAINKIDKKAKVIEFLENSGVIVNKNVEAIIESCVKELDIVTSTILEEIIEVENEK
jgi:hypothetical protein